MPERRNRPRTVKRAKRLRREQIGGHAFRKQAPIGDYVVDFVCLTAKLVVEADGGQHDWRREEDEVRTAWLEARGYRVLRFWNNEIFENIDGVLHVIATALGEPA